MRISTMTTDSRMTVTRQFVITEGNPVIPMVYSSTRKDVVVDRGVIQYTWQDGGWKVQDAWAIDLTGDVLKKDGNRSKNSHTRHPEDDYDWRVHDSGREWVAPPGWEWLDAVVAELRPSGNLSAPLLDDHEVGA
jgi:hypothetical protein